MPLQLKPTLFQRINLNLSTDEDPDQDTWVEIREATQAEQEQRDGMFADTSRVYREGQKELEVRARYSYQEQKRRETFLVLCGCNIMTEDGKPLFNFRKVNGKMQLAMDEAQFTQVWGSLPATVADEIHNAVLKVNTQWNPNSTSTR